MVATTTPFTAAGTILSISAALPASVTKTAYTALSWVVVGEITEIGDIGRTYAIVEHSPLATRGKVKLKGSFDDGTPAMKAAWVSGDPGQILMQTALGSDAFYAIKIAAQDGSVVYSESLVSAAPLSFGTVDTIVGVAFNLALKSGTTLIIPAT